MSDMTLAVALRFRDMVTEPGGTVAEHRRILRQQGRVWWGWWFRQSERVPRVALGALFDQSAEIPVLLLDSGALQLYRSSASEIVVAPTAAGFHSPDYDLTPDYYVRAQYPVWFLLTDDIVPVDTDRIDVVGRPTDKEESDRVFGKTDTVRSTSLESLRDDRPTLWVVADPVRTAS
jgi:hypothetical protein